MLRNVVPDRSGDNQSDPGATDTEHLPDFSVEESAFGVQAANFSDLVFRELRHWVARASSGPTFLGHVDHVVSMGTHSEVIGVDTRRIVARVHNHFSVWYRAIVKLVAEAVGVNMLVVVSHEKAVFPLESRANPLPAPIALHNLSPEALNWRPFAAIVAAKTVLLSLHRVAAFGARRHWRWTSHGLNVSQILLEVNP